MGVFESKDGPEMPDNSSSVYSDQGIASFCSLVQSSRTDDASLCRKLQINQSKKTYILMSGFIKEEFEAQLQAIDQ